MWHNEHWVSSSLLHLIGLAVVTDRILVLPPIYYREKYLAAWEWVDTYLLSTVVDWREASFLTNDNVKFDPRTTFARVDFDDAGIRLGRVTPDGQLGQVKHFANPIPVESPSNEEILHHRRNMWGAASSDLVSDVDVLYVSPDFAMPEMACFYPNNERRCDAISGPILSALHRAMAWCTINLKVLSKRQLKGLVATMDCKTKIDMWRDVRKQQQDRHNSNLAARTKKKASAASSNTTSP